jgi:hypothetical protein
MPLASFAIILHNLARQDHSWSTFAVLRRFSYHGSLQVAVASPRTLTQPIPVAPAAAALAQPAARALAVPLPVALAAATAAALAEPAAAAVALAAPPPLAEPAPWHATTTNAPTATTTRRRAGQPPLRGQFEL